MKISRLLKKARKNAEKTKVKPIMQRFRDGEITAEEALKEEAKNMLSRSFLHWSNFENAQKASGEIQVAKVNKALDDICAGEHIESAGNFIKEALRAYGDQRLWVINEFIKHFPYGLSNIEELWQLYDACGYTDRDEFMKMVYKIAFDEGRGAWEIGFSFGYDIKDRDLILMLANPLFFKAYWQMCNTVLDYINRLCADPECDEYNHLMAEPLGYLSEACEEVFGHRIFNQYCVLCAPETGEELTENPFKAWEEIDFTPYAERFPKQWKEHQERLNGYWNDFHIGQRFKFDSYCKDRPGLKRY